MATELKPCPFCGSQPLSIEHFTGGLKMWAIFCHVGEKCSMDAVSAIGVDESEAVATWNRRSDASQSLRSQAGVSEAVDWQWRSRIKGGAWDAWERGRFGQEIPPFMEVEERPLFARTDPIEVTDAMIERIARAFAAERYGDSSAFDVLRDGTSEKVMTKGNFRNLARAALQGEAK